MIYAMMSRYIIFTILAVLFTLVGCSSPPVPEPKPYVPQADLAFVDNVTYVKSGRISADWGRNAFTGERTWFSEARTTYKIELHVINKGDVATNSFSISVSVSGLRVPLKELVVNNIKPGNTVPVVFDIELFDGENNITITLDPEREIPGTQTIDYDHHLTINVPSLEEMLADRIAPEGPLSPAQIEYYTKNAYELAYNGGVWDKEIHDLAEESLGRVIDSIYISDFGLEEVWAFHKAHFEYLYIDYSPYPDLLAVHRESDRERTEEYSKRDTRSKRELIERMKDVYTTSLGGAPGALAGAYAPYVASHPPQN